MASGRVASHASCSKADPGEAGWVSLLPCRIGISDSGDRGRAQGERHRLGRLPCAGCISLKSAWTFV